MTQFSVVVPLYNKGPHIQRAIASALSQTVPPSEIIVVDDGSTDGGYEFVQRLSDPRIKLHKRGKPGPGGYAARNYAIELAESEWIAFLDADDEWMPRHLELIEATIKRCDRPEALVSVSNGYRIVFPGGREEKDIYTNHRGSADPEFLQFAALLDTWLHVGGAPIWTSATVCRKSALMRAGMFPAERCSRGGDKDLWLRIAALGLTAINPVIASTYYKDSVNMVTEKLSVNARHCLCHTIEEMLTHAATVPARLLRKVYNLEIFKYCVRTVKTEKLSTGSWRGFYVAENPFQFLILAIFSQRFVAQAIRAVLRLRYSPGKKEYPMTNLDNSTATTTKSLEDLAKPHNAGCARSFAELKRLLRADLFRYAGKADLRSFLRHFLFTPGYKYTVWMRTCGYLRIRCWTKYSLYPLVKYILLRCRYKYGIVIPEYTVIGPGLFINRFGGIYINGDAIIGSNVNLTHGIMLGQANRGPLMGSPIVGDRVFLAAGCKIIGRVKLGNGAVVGANAVVTKDVPENAVVGGIPAKILSLQGSEDYVNKLAPL
jgi:serine O-acetyltransferase